MKSSPAYLERYSGRYSARSTEERSASAATDPVRRRSAVFHRGVRVQLRPVVLRVDDADRPRLGAHDEALCSCPFAPVTHAAQQFAVGDARRRKEHIVTGDEVVEHQDLVEVVTGVDRAVALFVVARPKLALDRAAESLQRARGDDTFGSAADTE